MLLRRLFWIPNTRSPAALIVAYIRLAWILTIICGELGSFYYAASRCTWPDLGNHERYFHILLVADPQILDKTSYPGRPWWLMALTQHIVDFNLRKSWRAVKGSTKPEMTVFLGDMMDNGRGVVSEKEYQAYFSKFQSIFKHDSKDPVYYIPGNHDVDLGPASPELLKTLARVRYTSNFGPLNQILHLHNTTVTLLLIDAPGLVDEYNAVKKYDKKEDWKMSTGEATQYLLSYANQSPSNPNSLILFTHIPLFRPTKHDDGPDSCGDLRQGRRPIYNEIGLGYQNFLPKEISEFILDRLQPGIIFSGDDHDHCDYKHIWHLSQKSVREGLFTREITVTSFSMAMGVRKPGYQLLSVPTGPQKPFSDGGYPVSSSTHYTQACSLPDQIGLYLFYYVPFAALCLAALIWATIYEASEASAQARHGLPIFSPMVPEFTDQRAEREKREALERKGGGSKGLVVKIFKNVLHVLSGILCIYVLVVWWVRLTGS